MLGALLPELLLKALEKLDKNKVYEIRLRRNSPIVVNYQGRNISLLTEGFVGEKIFASNQMLQFVLARATENSLYAFNNQIKQGFITAKGGIRIGIAGESVNSDNFMPTTIKNINSINIRLPHEVKNCALTGFKFMVGSSGIKNTLIISPPGAGKTTFLRDIARLISKQEIIYNCLIVDERFEICSCLNGEPMLDVGEYSDIVSGASKLFAFTSGIRAMKPDVILTDELIGEEDAEACIRAMRSGVKVIATIHANNQFEICDKKEFKNLFSGKFFERIVVLSCRKGPGTYEGIYDENMNCLYF